MQVHGWDYFNIKLSMIKHQILLIICKDLGPAYILPITWLPCLSS